MYYYWKKFWILFFLFFLSQISYSSSEIVYKGEGEIKYIGEAIDIFEDTTNELSINEVVASGHFAKSINEVPNLSISSSTFWVRITIKNQSDQKLILLQLSYPLMDIVELYSPLPTGGYKIDKTGARKNFSERLYKHQDFIFPLTIPVNETYTYYLKIAGDDQLMVPLTLGKPEVIASSLLHKDMLFAGFFGIIAVMILYNLFLFFTIKDINYLLYVAYILCMGFTQATLEGYPFNYLWPDYPGFVNSSITAFPSLSGILIVVFMASFLQTKIHLPLFNKLALVFIIGYSLAIVFSFLGFNRLAFRVVDFNAGFVSVGILWGAVKIAKLGHRSARFMLVGWIIVLCGFVIFAMRNLGILPYNEFSNYTMVAGVTLEVIVFSLALADRINILKKENEAKQDQIIKHLKENEEYLKISQELAVNSERLKKEILSSNYESLKNQVNPHFLFNSLNVLTELVYRNQDEAAKFVKELSVIYRYVLENKNKEVVYIQAELDFIRSFTYLLKIRYGSNIHIDIMQDFKKEYMVAPLAMQLLVENCIKHNIVSKDEPLTIKIYSEGAYLVVSNNLQIKEAINDSSKIGLKNIQERYHYLSDKPVVIDNDGQNFKVKIPLLVVS